MYRPAAWQPHWSKNGDLGKRCGLVILVAFHNIEHDLKILTRFHNFDKISKEIGLTREAREKKKQKRKRRQKKQTVKRNKREN